MGGDVFQQRAQWHCIRPTLFPALEPEPSAPLPYFSLFCSHQMSCIASRSSLLRLQCRAAPKLKSGAVARVESRCLKNADLPAAERGRSNRAVSPMPNTACHGSNPCHSALVAARLSQPQRHQDRHMQV